MSDRKKLVLLLVIALVVILLYLGLGLNSRNWDYALPRRIPKLMAIVLTGSAIAFSTVVFQTITNNRILTPSVMGLDSLYLTVQTILVFVFGSGSAFVLNKNLNFVIAVGLMVLFAALLFRVLFKKDSTNIFFLLLVGMILGTLFGSMSSFLQMVIDPNEFLIVQNKMFASFNNVNTGILTLSGIIFLAIVLYTWRYFKTFDVLALGREQAINLGVEYEKIVKRMLLIIAILVSVSTGLVGPITFLGLLVANLAREFVSSYQHKYIVAGAVLISVIALVGGQILVERIFNFSTPISVLINLIGGVYFIYLLLKEQRI